MGIFGLFSKETLYFPGCYTSSFLPAKIENYKNILKKLKLDFFMLKNKEGEFKCCGGFLDEAGYEKQKRKHAKSNASFFEENKIKKIITSCPLCYTTLKNYKELLPNYSLEIEFILTSIINTIKENDTLIRSFPNQDEKIVYYDSCYLARTMDFIEQPRELLRILGFNLVEIQNYNKKKTLCCGSCGNLPITNQALANKIAIDFIKMLKRKGIKKIITADARDFKHITENLEFLGTKDLQVLEISDILCDSLGIKKEEEDKRE